MRIGDKITASPASSSRVRLLALVASLVLAGCAHPGAERVQRPRHAGGPDRQATPGAETAQRHERLSEISWEADAFNPTRGDRVVLRYAVSGDETVTIRIYDPDGGIVRHLLQATPRAAGLHEEFWDGRDDDGQMVPDEAYTATIETASAIAYDPTTSSGGIVGDITDAQFDRETGTVVYTLPAAARVLIRLGIHDGPMLKTLVDWKPRVAGAITEYWDGRDEDQLIRLREHTGFTALVTYVTLPAATVIAYGNDRPQKPNRPRMPDPSGRLLAGHLVPPAWMRAPRVLMTFPGYDGSGQRVPEVQDAIEVHVDVAPDDRDQLLQEQFEVIFFLDNVFVAEAERGYLPFNWRWELQRVPPGEHVLTVNVSSFKGQVGVASRKVRVVSTAD